jgi:hypothetical protein
MQGERVYCPLHETLLKCFRMLRYGIQSELSKKRLISLAVAVEQRAAGSSESRGQRAEGTDWGAESRADSGLWRADSAHRRTESREQSDQRAESRKLTAESRE